MRNRTFSVGSLVVVAACGGSNEAPDSAAMSAPTAAPLQLMLAPPAEAGPDEEMGHSVAIRGDVAVVGAFDSATHMQSAFVYRAHSDGWTFEQRLPLEGQQISGFVPGRGKIRYDGERIAVETFSGVFLYRHDGRAWTPDLVVSRAELGKGQFEAVTVDGDLFAYTFHTNADQPGGGESRVHVYRHASDGWVKATECVPADGANVGFEGFGSVLVFGEDTLFASSGSHGEGGRRGAAYEFQLADHGCVQRSRLTIADADENAQMGSAMSVSATRVILGAPYERVGGDDGTVFEFVNRNGAWVPGARIVHSGAGENRFGDAIAMEGDTIVAGCPFAHDDWRGAAYVLRLEGGSWRATELVDATTGRQQGFGFDVATDGRRAIVSSWGQTAMRIGDLGGVLQSEPEEPAPAIRRGAAIYDLERGWK